MLRYKKTKQISTNHTIRNHVMRELNVILYQEIGISVLVTTATNIFMLVTSVLKNDLGYILTVERTFSSPVIFLWLDQEWWICTPFS